MISDTSRNVDTVIRLRRFCLILLTLQVRQPKFEPSANSSRPHHAAINRKKEEEKIKKENYVSLLLRLSLISVPSQIEVIKICVYPLVGGS